MAQSLAKIFKYVLLGALVLMSFMAGVAKLTEMPHEVEFFELASISTAILLPFGIFQTLGAALAVNPKTRKIGLIIMALAFFASVVLIYLSGDTVFALMSLTPVGIAMILAFTKWGAEIRPSK
ncbi:MAG: hypothetical protein ABJN22_14190 [Litorimonas sp.]